MKMMQHPYVENVVLDVTDLDTGVLCSWPVLEQRLKPEWNRKESWVVIQTSSQRKLHL